MTPHHNNDVLVRTNIKRGEVWLRSDRLARVCVECDRRFDLTDATDATEWAYGHDCEST